RAPRRAVPRARLVPAQPDRLLRAVRAARAPVRAPARAARLSARVAHGPLVLLRLHPVRAGDHAAHPAAGDGALRLGRERARAGGGARAAVRRPIRRDPALDRPDPVLGPPRVPRGAVALALPPDPPLGAGDGL